MTDFEPRPHVARARAPAAPGAGVGVGAAGGRLPRLHGPARAAERDRDLGRPPGVLGRGHRDRVGRRAHDPVSREAVAPADGADGPDCGRAGVGHRVLRVDGPDAARRARRRAAHPAGRRVRVRASPARSPAEPEGDDGGGGRLPGRGPGGRPHDGRATGQAGAVRSVGLPRGVGGGAGGGGGRPAAPAAAGADDPPAGGGRVPGVDRERGRFRAGLRPRSTRP